jgi:hypothetical protein
VNQRNENVQINHIISTHNHLDNALTQSAAATCDSFGFLEGTFWLTNMDQSVHSRGEPPPEEESSPAQGEFFEGAVHI